MATRELTADQLTRMLNAWSGGDAVALEQLTPVVYAELRRLAGRHLAGEREGHILQPSALVNEAFIRLLGGSPVEWSSRTHFFAVCARLMRQILIDLVRAQVTNKRGNRSPHIDLAEVQEILPGTGDRRVDFMDLDSALNDLEKLDPRQSQIVELRYFGGLENTEIAAVLHISEPTVTRDWRLARLWLYDRLR